MPLVSQDCQGHLPNIHPNPLSVRSISSRNNQTELSCLCEADFVLMHRLHNLLSSYVGLCYCSSRSLVATSTWSTILVQFPIVPWHKIVWFSKFMPRHRFILWLVIEGKLRTKDKLQTWGITVNLSCPLWNIQDEALDHLFSECPSSDQVWSCISVLCNIPKGPNLLVSQDHLDLL